MSFKDDFVEALRSVKRDFFRESESGDKERNETSRQEAQPAAGDAVVPESLPSLDELRAEAAKAKAQPQQPAAAAQDDDDVLEAFRQASAIVDADDDSYGADAFSSGALPDDSAPPAAAPFRSYDPAALVPSEPTRYEGERAYIDFGENGLYDDDKTVISKNTVIRGGVETADSIRLLGQVLGDIDCKSNIVVAGKVRGNTSAANAYIFDAQVNGDVRCDDVITISNDAWVLGNLRAQQAEIDGKVKGNMEIRHMVSIGASSSILGDISTDELEIKRGAFINGQIMMYSPSRDVLDRFDRFGE